MNLTDDVKQRKQKHFKQYRAAKQKLTNKENLARFLHRGKPLTTLYQTAFCMYRSKINFILLVILMPYFDKLLWEIIQQ